MGLKVPGTGGDPEDLGLQLASKESAIKFKRIFEGAKMLNDAAAASQWNGVRTLPPAQGGIYNTGLALISGGLVWCHCAA